MASRIDGKTGISRKSKARGIWHAACKAVRVTAAERSTNEDRDVIMLATAIDRSPAAAMLLSLLATAACSLVCLGAAVGPAIV